MTEKKLYTCDICKTDYADKEKAKQCEKNHKLLEKATIVGAINLWVVFQQENQLKFELSFQTRINGLNTSDNFV